MPEANPGFNLLQMMILIGSNFIIYVAEQFFVTHSLKSALYVHHFILNPSRHLTISSNFRPDGQKKAYVRLASDYDALDVANKIGII